MRRPAKLPTVGASFPGSASAACRGYPSDLFFPEQGAAANPARSICAWCTCQPGCLAFAMDENTRQPFGIWGGATADERQALRAGRMSMEQLRRQLRKVAEAWKPPSL